MACRAQASWALRTSSSRASATASGPAEASSSSVPENWTNATPTARCSEVPAAARRCSRSGGVSRLATSTSPSGSMLGVGGPGDGLRRMSRAPSTAAPSTDASSSAAVSWLTSTWPAFASSSSSAVRLAAGPLTTSSRCSAGSPTRKKWKVPLCRPTDIRRFTRPADDWARPAVRSSVRMSTAARTARVAWSAPRNSSRTASPPHFTRSPPSRRAWASSALKTACRMSLSSSEPTAPCRVSRRARAVKPEMSTKAIVPSTARALSSAWSRSHSMARSGT